MNNLQETKKAVNTKFKKFMQNIQIAAKPRLTQSIRPNFVGFTLAETLITLGIIGVVAALTLPPLINKFRVKQLEVAFKRSSSLIEQSLQKTAHEFGYAHIKDLYMVCGLPGPNGSLQTENYNNCVAKYGTELIPQMSSFFLSNFKVIKSENWSANFYAKCSKIKVYSYAGYNANSYCNLYGVSPSDAKGLSILLDGTMITNGWAFMHHGQYDSITFTFDINGPYKGPNRYGYDIFIYDTGTWYKLCSKNSTDVNGFNGRGCYDYALKDVNPDDSTKGYWESLKL